MRADFGLLGLHRGQQHEITCIEYPANHRFGTEVCLPNPQMRSYEIKIASAGAVVQATKFILVASLFLYCANTFAQSVDDDKEPAAVLELGAAASRSLTEGESSFGPTVAVEITPIENWLELEAGVTPLFSRHATEWSTDLLFKKPWNLSKKVEFMAGIGPEWIHTNRFGARANSVSGEIVADFMFWHSPRHRFGWYLEPSYDYNFGPGHEKSVGVTGGLLIGIR